MLYCIWWKSLYFTMCVSLLIFFLNLCSGITTYYYPSHDVLKSRNFIVDFIQGLGKELCIDLYLSLRIYSSDFDPFLFYVTNVSRKLKKKMHWYIQKKNNIDFCIKYPMAVLSNFLWINTKRLKKNPFFLIFF